MSDYLQIANSKILVFAVIIMLTFVFAQSMIFLRMALKRAKALGMDHGKIKSAFKTGAITCIVPTLAIIVAFFALAPVLGVPISWGRLSVIGSLMYEVTAAGIGAEAMGAELGGASFTPQVFANAVWTMCIGSCWSVLACALFLKKIKSGYKKSTSKDDVWGRVLSGAAFMGVFANFIAKPVVKGGNSLLALGTSAIVMALLTFLITRFKVKWLKEFSLGFSMIAAFAVVTLMSL